MTATASRATPRFNGLARRTVYGVATRRGRLAHDHTREIAHILFHPAFPVDVRHNAKIFREKLAEWAARTLP